MPKITEIYAFIADDVGPDDEGIPAMMVGNVLYPMVAADVERVETMRPFAVTISKETGKKIKLVKFTTREEVEDSI